MKEILTAIILDTRRAKKDGIYPVKLRLTHKKKQKYLRTDYAFTEKVFTEITNPKPKKKYKEIQLKLQAVETRANEIIEDMPVFSFDSFEKMFTNGKTAIDETDACTALDLYREKLTKQGRASYAISFVKYTQLN